MPASPHPGGPPTTAGPDAPPAGPEPRRTPFHKDVEMPTVTLAPARSEAGTASSRRALVGFAVPPAPPERPLPEFPGRDPRDAAFLQACVRLARALRAPAGG